MDCGGDVQSPGKCDQVFAEKELYTDHIIRLDIYTKITVSDEGVGIPKNEYNLIFKRFYRGRNARQQEGSGLGLYLAQLIVQHENGYITVASREGRGSSFSMFLLNKKDERNIIQGTISSQYPSGSVMK